MTGVDFAGLLYVSDSKSKVYIALFTCAVIRAVHLEFVFSMETDEFVKSFRRFCSRRGTRRIIYSDNAKTFKRAELEVKFLFKLMDSSKFREFLSMERIEWRYIVEHAPWWGGFWERMVRTVRNSLKLSRGKNLLDFSELQTVLTEIEYLINSRSLAPLHDTLDDINALSPNDFLLNKRENLPVLNNYHYKDPEDANLMKIWKTRQLNIVRFWKR